MGADVSVSARSRQEIVVSANGSPAVTPSTEFRFTSSDGVDIACARWDNHGPLRGVVQIAHGMGEHVRRYAGTIEVLTSAGLRVYGNDHRGHGRTARSAADFGNFGADGFDLLVADMLRLTHIAEEENPGAPLILLGHSMGSFAAQQYVLENSREIDGLVLSGSGALDQLAKLVTSAPVGTNVLNLPFEPARTPLSRDRAIVDAFMTDPLCFANLQPAAFASFLAAGGRLSDANVLQQIRDDLPVYLFSGSEDPVGQQLAGIRLLIERYRAAGVRDVSHDFYFGGRHEMLNEINRGQVCSRLLDWISSTLDEDENLNLRRSSHQILH